MRGTVFLDYRPLYLFWKLAKLAFFAPFTLFDLVLVIRNDSAVPQVHVLLFKTARVSLLLKRIYDHKQGLEEPHLLRIVDSLVTSRVLYTIP